MSMIRTTTARLLALGALRSVYGAPVRSFDRNGSSALHGGSMAFVTLNSSTVKHCTSCVCECSWATPSTCKHDDGSCCHKCCCSTKPPGPPPPTPPAPAPAPPVANGTLYCPDESDFTSGGASVKWATAADGTSGWTVTGPGGVHGKATFNLLGGYVSFVMDVSRANAQVNTNFYTSSPVSCCAYCDIQKNKSPQCMEMDIIENNGKCQMATTWHTYPNHDGGCDEGGCAGHARLPATPFKMQASFSMDGYMTTTLNGVPVTVKPDANATAVVASTMKSRGAMFHSTQWQGWEPDESGCPKGGDLKTSTFKVSNVRVYGTVVQGTEPKRCPAA